LAADAGSSSGGPLSCTTMWTWQESAARLTMQIHRTEFHGKDWTEVLRHTSADYSTH